MKICEKEFVAMRGLIYDKFGINLSDEKRSLLAGRLQKLPRDEGFTSFGEYYFYLSRKGSPASISKLIYSVSTNHTYFNRKNSILNILRR